MDMSQYFSPTHCGQIARHKISGNSDICCITDITASNLK